MSDVMTLIVRILLTTEEISMTRMRRAFRPTYVPHITAELIVNISCKYQVQARATLQLRHIIVFNVNIDHNFVPVLGMWWENVILEANKISALMEI